MGCIAFNATLLLSSDLLAPASLSKKAECETEGSKMAEIRNTEVGIWCFPDANVLQIFSYRC